MKLKLLPPCEPLISQAIDLRERIHPPESTELDDIPALPSRLIFRKLFKA
jgi:hypothetical protein